MVGRSQLARGQVWFVTFDGLAQDRPSIVLTRPSLAPRILQQLVIPCTRTVRNVQSEVLLTPADGLPDDCVANAAQATVAHVAQFRRLICTLSTAKMDEIGQALAWFAGLV